MQVVRGQLYYRPECQRRSGCAARRAPPVTRLISRLCDAYGKCCVLQITDAQCKCNGCCGQRREKHISLRCRSRFFTGVYEPFAITNLWSLGWKLSISAPHYILPSNKSKFQLFLARSLICPSQSNLEFAGYITVALRHNVQLKDSPSTTDRTNGVALGSGRAE